MNRNGGSVNDIEDVEAAEDLLGNEEEEEEAPERMDIVLNKAVNAQFNEFILRSII